MTVSAAIAVCLLALPGVAPQTGKFMGAPETFSARANVATEAARGDVYVTIHVMKYSTEHELDAVVKALDASHAAFLDALKKSPIAGQIEVGKQTFTIRWAREAKDAKGGRVITLVTDKPIYFVGAGVPGAKSREGYDVAIVQLMMDSAGLGEGTMAAAAKVKSGGDAGVQVDDYGTQPVKLLSVKRQIQ
jgi:hypothetical protein